jgi:hypothetical protein
MKPGNPDDFHVKYFLLFSPTGVEMLIIVGNDVINALNNQVRSVGIIWNEYTVQLLQSSN